MVTLINKNVRRDLYEILEILNSDLGLWVEGNYKNEWGITLITGENTRRTYQYPSEVTAKQDIKQLRKLKELICKQ